MIWWLIPICFWAAMTYMLCDMARMRLRRSRRLARQQVRDAIQQLEGIRRQAVGRRMALEAMQIVPDWASEWWREINAVALGGEITITQRPGLGNRLPQRRIQMRLRLTPNAYLAHGERIRAFLGDDFAVTFEGEGAVVITGEILPAFADEMYQCIVTAPSPDIFPAAQARAADLLRDILTPAEWDEYRQQGFVTIPSQLRRNRTYVVRPFGVMVSVQERGQTCERLCLVAEDGQIPDADVVAAKVLLLKYDEAAFLKTANHFHFGA